MPLHLKVCPKSFEKIFQTVRKYRPRTTRPPTLRSIDHASQLVLSVGLDGTYV